MMARIIPQINFVLISSVLVACYVPSQKEQSTSGDPGKNPNRKVKVTRREIRYQEGKRPLRVPPPKQEKAEKKCSCRDI